MCVLFTYCVYGGGLFRYTLKATENQKLCDIIRAYKNRSVTQNELINSLMRTKKFIMCAVDVNLGLLELLLVLSNNVITKQ